MHNLDPSPVTPEMAPKERFEQEKLTRREALRKIGLTAGLAALATISIDDMARLAATKLKENKSTKALGEQMSKEFANAGIARADLAGCLDIADMWYAGCRGDLSVPWGCDPNGGSILPWCLAYDLDLIYCRQTHTELSARCDQMNG